MNKTKKIFKKISTFDKTLASLIKNKIEKTQINLEIKEEILQLILQKYI